MGIGSGGDGWTLGIGKLEYFKVGIFPTKTRILKSVGWV
jgi:hypothetical protein